MRLSGKWLGYALASAALMVAGCAADAAEPVEVAEPINTHQVDFSAVFIAGGLDETTHEWIQSKITACAALQGYGYVSTDFLPNQSRSSDSRDVRAEYGYGYALTSRVVENHTFQPLSSEIAGMSDEQADAYFIAIDECEANAVQTLDHTKQDFLSDLTDDERQLFDSVRTWNHSATREAMRLWTACMHAAGYPDVNTISDVLTKASAMFNQPELLPEEVQLALADWDCSHSDGVQNNIEQAYDELNRRLSGRFHEALLLGA